VAATGAGLLACLAATGLLVPALAFILVLPLGVACTFCAVVAGARLGAFLGVGTGLLVFAGQLSGLLVTATLARAIAQALTRLG
jgi:hypothetical protein